MSPLVTLTALVALATATGHMAEIRVRTAQAERCAQRGNGTDAGIAACYRVRGLSEPEWHQ